jgi:hypothetical protein
MQLSQKQMKHLMIDIAGKNPTEGIFNFFTKMKLSDFFV